MRAPSCGDSSSNASKTTPPGGWTLKGQNGGHSHRQTISIRVSSFQSNFLLKKKKKEEEVVGPSVLVLFTEKDRTHLVCHWQLNKYLLNS